MDSEGGLALFGTFVAYGALSIGLYFLVLRPILPSDDATPARGAAGANINNNNNNSYPCMWREEYRRQREYMMEVLQEHKKHQRTRHSNDEKLALLSMKCSYEELQDAIRDINFASRRRRATTTKNLPPDLCTHIANFLTVKRCDNSKVKAVSASSMDTRNVHELDACLKDDFNSWWVSAPGSMPDNRGEEYVQFQLCPKNTLCRLEAVFMKVDPLGANGPLSLLCVREFRVEVSDNEEGPFRRIPQVFQVAMNWGRMQRIPIGSIDAQSIRVVCLANQFGEFIVNVGRSLPPGAPAGQFFQSELTERVGFYTIEFE